MDANGLPTIPCISRGQRLDRWVLWDSATTRTLLQVEIKNWSAHSSGGRRLRLNASEIEKREFRQNAGNGSGIQKGGRFKDDEVQKVLSAMPVPGYSFDGASHKKIEPAPEVIEPAVVFWFCIHPTGEPVAFFPFELPATPGCPFRRIWCFSMSEYLRKIVEGGEDRVRLPLLETGPRMLWLDRLLSCSVAG
jgi:hypothetical protein